MEPLPKRQLLGALGGRRLANDLPPLLAWDVTTYPALLWFPAVGKPHGAGVDTVLRLN